MKKVKIVVLASMVGLLALFGVSAQAATAGATSAATVVPVTSTVSATPVAANDQGGNHEFEGEEADSSGQPDNEVTASSEENGTEKPDAEESGAIEQGSAKSELGAQALNAETESTADTDNLEVQE